VEVGVEEDLAEAVDLAGLVADRQAVAEQAEVGSEVFGAGNGNEC